MPDLPIPPREWNSRIPARDVDSGHDFPPRPEVVEVTESDLDRIPRAAGVVEHEGHRPSDAPLRSTPEVVPPEQQTRGRWQRPPGQEDDKGEPTHQKK